VECQSTYPNKTEYDQLLLDIEKQEKDQVANLKKYMLEKGLDAARCLVELMDCHEPQIQLGASKAVLGHVVKISGLEVDKVEFTKPLEFKPYNPLEGESA